MTAAAHEVSFAVSAADRALVDKIVSRALADGLIRKRERLSTEMDLCATAANGCPMDFAKLLAADDFNFAHDLYGIEDHLDRATGRLLNHFRPRCAAPSPTKAA
ncbi:hypothetical protein GCM10008171_32510 [Methylopila jiangsuensis]|uniref:DUF6874 domain-containing protein n=1 Tax=Methylopila jiangsuensis TaxID=586230 RepID=A0A9W6N593_9HYPH|nr:hypothetical protein [Methylopila jiangsuensis]MDR6284613.1 hypothetical protein [Methylopila jiangsuensis]GLK77997.1 hypothetical protein GCM10008171_32510 [Methylopila jiangsuensis]